MRKTKIICTMGPATEDDSVLEQLMLGGMNVCRINFSHGTEEEHLKTISRIKKMRERLKLPIALLLDTSGPEIRIGTFKKDKIELVAGQTFSLTTEDIEGTNERVSVTYKNLVNDVSSGTTILIDDGLVEMTVKEVTATDVICVVENGGVISNRKGVNVPNAELSMPYISDKDRDDIIFGVKNDFDFIAASFVRCADDVAEIRKILAENGDSRMKIISKIENRQGVNNIDEIIRISDGVMVARGDLGVEIPIREIPSIQKEIIKRVYSANKIVITATQMLDSMMKNPRPTRAEATDVANAIYDGTSAIMLSGETAAGKYPIEALRTMVEIAEYTENDIDYKKRFRDINKVGDLNVTSAISHATCMTAIDINASVIITVTKSGRTARIISRYRPECPIIGCTPSMKSYYQMNLSWGVVPMLITEQTDSDSLFTEAMESTEKAGYIKPGELAVITAGLPLGVSGTTNLIKVAVAGNTLIKGMGVGKNSVCSSLCVGKTPGEVKARFKDGDIIVTYQTDNGMIELLKRCGGIIVEMGGWDSHAAVAGLSLDIPVILGAKNATEILKQGAVVRLDAQAGIVTAMNN